VNVSLLGIWPNNNSTNEDTLWAYNLNPNAVLSGALRIADVNLYKASVYSPLMAWITPV